MTSTQALLVRTRICSGSVLPAGRQEFHDAPVPVRASVLAELGCLSRTAAWGALPEHRESFGNCLKSDGGWQLRGNPLVPFPSPSVRDALPLIQQLLWAAFCISHFWGGSSPVYPRALRHWSAPFPNRPIGDVPVKPIWRFQNLFQNVYFFSSPNRLYNWTKSALEN